MSYQPFRVYKPLARILHNTLLQRVQETKNYFSLPDIDALYTYSAVDGVKHEEVCHALTQCFTEVHQRGEAVFTADGLLFPLRGARRGLNALQRFPNTDTALEVAKRETERAILRDVLRLSNEDIASRDVTYLWSFALQLSRWDLVEELFSHFPLQQTLSMQDAREFRELVVWACQCNQVTTSDGSFGHAAMSRQDNTWHAQRFLTDVFGVEETVARLRAALADSAAMEHGDATLDLRRREEREGTAFACAALAATLRKRCGGAVADFPVKEEEWAQWYGVHSNSGSFASSSPSSGSGGSGSSSISGLSSGALRLNVTHMSFPVWGRRAIAAHDPAVPPYVTATLAGTLASEMHLLYKQRDPQMVNTFFLVIMPYLIRTNPSVDVRRVFRSYHDQVMREMFWIPTGSSPSASASSGKRGKWTAQSLEGDRDGATSADKGAASAASSSAGGAAISFHMSLETALNMLLGEMCLMADEEPLVAAHVPALETMLRTVLNHLRTHMWSSSGSGFGVKASSTSGSAAGSLPLSLWRVWSPAQTTALAVVVSQLLRAGRPSAATPSSASEGADVYAGLRVYPALHDLVAESIELLRRLLDVAVLQERGTAALVSALLTTCPDVVEAVGGRRYEAQLRSIALEHATDGFSHQNLKDMAAVALAREQKQQQQHQEVPLCSDSSRASNDAAAAAAQAQTMDYVQQLEAAQKQLPLRLWF